MTGFDSAAKRPEDMTREELVDLVHSQREEGVRITFAGKDVAKRIARKVQPRTSRRLAKYSVGTEEEQARNQVIEGENLQAMVTLYRERGKLTLSSPTRRTTPGTTSGTTTDGRRTPTTRISASWSARTTAARHTKWMRFMWPRLQMMGRCSSQRACSRSASTSASCSVSARCSTSCSGGEPPRHHQLAEELLTAG